MEPTPTAGREQAINLSVHHKIISVQTTMIAGNNKPRARKERSARAESANIMQLTHAILVWKTKTLTIFCTSYIQLTMSRMTISRLLHKRWYERIQCADGSLFRRCTTRTYTWIARQPGDVNRYVQGEKTSATVRVLNALKYARRPAS
jgi:hypothetical protein